MLMLIKNRTNVYDFKYLLVFTTKYREEIFSNNHLCDDMQQILETIATNKNVLVERLMVMPDHVQMILSFPPDIAPTNVVKSLKGTSAREWFKLHPETKEQLLKGHLWSSSFFMLTLGDDSPDAIEQYLNSQSPQN